MIWIIASIAMGIWETSGDFFIKKSTELSGRGSIKFLLVGILIYASGALGWFFIFRHLKLATISVYFALSSILFLTLLGVIVFHEKLNAYEIAGIVFAIISIILLARFS